MSFGIIRIPIISDIFDKRAKSKDGDFSVLDIFKVSLPAVLGSLLTIGNTIGEALSSWISVAIYIQASVPLLILIACCMLISRRVLINGTSLGFNEKPNHQEYSYRHSAGERTVAKLLFFPLLFITANEIWGLVPNKIAGKSYVAGYLCNSVDGTPKQVGTIEALDSFGNSVSKSFELLDDEGFFFIDLKPWGIAPEKLRVESPDCDQKILSMHDAYSDGYRCPSSSRRNAQKNRVFPVWRFQCK